ncbi:hypothetical protein CTI12_AA327450 [Artemisia annua]|uniref:Uncharacterized protein n=1 Tax=Artemisia annua TaxID=35608 RepID=A0A2U1MYK7_ARTAN|nr:hypothetical protein CTI12_AA327450 [Artemisia annua]
MDFDFKSSSYGYTSAPSSPKQLTELYCGFDELLIDVGATCIRSLATVPFAWEEKPGVPKTPKKLSEDEFSFDQMVTPSSPTPSANGSKKWSFMDLFLFRSASDGRAMDRDPLKKYSANFRKHDQDVRSSGSMSKRRGRVSAHEHHYTVNRAVSNDLKKKTYLPYKQGILGRFSFNP